MENLTPEKLVSAIFCVLEIPGFFVTCIEKTNKFPKKKKLLGGRIESGDPNVKLRLAKEIFEETSETIEVEPIDLVEICILEAKNHLEQFFYCKAFVDKQNILPGKEIESLHLFPKDGKELLSAVANGDFLPRHGEAIKTFLYLRK